MAVYLYRTLPQTYDEFDKQMHGFIGAYLTGMDGTPAPPELTVPPWPKAPSAAVLAGIEKRREKWVQSAKHAPKYNADTDGVALRIEPTGSPFEPVTYQAEITSVTSTAPAQVEAKFRKAGGNITGVEFKGRKAGTMNMQTLGRFTVSPASLFIPLAAPGQAEQWEIQGQALKGDTLIGTPSDIKPVLVRG